MEDTLEHRQVEERLEALKTETYKQALYWQGEDESEPKDVVIAAFADALLVSLESDSRMQQMMGSVLYKRPTLNIPMVFNLAFRCAQKQEMMNKRFIENYPHGRYATKEKWLEVFDHLVDPDTPEHTDFFDDMSERRLQSTKPQRYIGAILIRALAVDRLGENPYVIDVGCSQNLGLKQQKLVEELPDISYFNKVKVAPAGVKLGPHAGGWPVDEQQTEIVNAIIQNSRHIKGGTGIDKEHMDNIRSQEFAKACSFYPSELLDPHELEIYELLETAVVEGVNFYQDDFTKMDVGKFKDETQIKGAGLITIFTMLNQLNKAKRRQAMAKVEELVSQGVVQADGIVAIEEFARIRPKYKDQITINPKGARKSGEYKLFVRDLSEDSGELHHITTFDNGRCGRLQLQPAIGRFGLSHRFGLVA